jgi:hypothetical protein
MYAIFREGPIVLNSAVIHSDIGNNARREYKGSGMHGTGESRSRAIQLLELEQPGASRTSIMHA